MEVRKKRNRWGEYYLVTTTLRVNGKAFRVSQARADPNKPVHSWRVNRAQMRKILEITRPEDWLFATIYRFDGMVDGTEYGDRVFRPANAETIAWIRRFCLDSEGDTIEYITGDRDQYGNKLEKGVFELWNVATHHYQLKPARDDLVRIDLDGDGKNEIPDVIDLSELEPTQEPKTQDLPEPPRRKDEKGDLGITGLFNLTEEEIEKVLAAFSSAVRSTENPAQAIRRFTSMAPRELRKAFMFGFLLGAAADTNATTEKDKPDYIG